MNAYSIVLQRFGVLTDYDSMINEDVELLKDWLLCTRKNFALIFQQNLDNLCVSIKNRETMKSQVDSSAQMFKTLRNSGVYQAFLNTEILMADVHQ